MFETFSRSFRNYAGTNNSIMRILTLTLLVAAMAINFSCKKSDDADPVAQNNTGNNNNNGGGGNNTGGANVAPTVSITAPAEGEVFSIFVGGARTASPGPGPTIASVTIAADAADSDGTISKVEFYNGTTLLGEDTEAPYSYTSLFGPADYTITVKAYDDDNASTESEEVNFSVEVQTIIVF
jgi:hypothetical protein